MRHLISLSALALGSWVAALNVQSVPQEGPQDISQATISRAAVPHGCDACGDACEGLGCPCGCQGGNSDKLVQTNRTRSWEDPCLVSGH